MRKILQGICILLCLPLINIQAQKPDDIKISQNLVIENVMLVTKAGANPQKASIVIEGGIITQIGNNIKTPNDAILIKGDSLYAYPAFIDACSHTGIPKKDKDEKRKDVNDPDNPGWERAGITPQRSVHDLLKMSDSSVKDMRKQGFAVSHVVPNGRMLPGMGSIILLSDSEDPSYLNKDASMFGSLRSAKGRVYPSTVIAVMAKYRNLVMQAKAGQAHESKYASNPIGLKRPNYPEELRALYPVVGKSQAFFMQAEKTLDISRAITLNKELGFNMTIVEAKQAWPNIQSLKQNNVSLIVSLDIPEDMKEEKVDSTKAADPERDALIARKKKSIVEYQNNAKVALDNNIPLAFSFLDVKSKDIHKNLMKLSETGIDKTALLNALTLTPARILGIDNVTGSLEKGKLGNIVMTDKVMFEKDMNIHYTIVEGNAFKYDVDKKKKKKKKKDGDSKDDGSVDLAGEWRITVDIPPSGENATLKFKKDGDSYSGILIDDEGEETPLESIELDGTTLTMTFDMVEEGMNITMEISAEIDGDSMEGSLTAGEFGSFPIEGSKLNPKN